MEQLAQQRPFGDEGADGLDTEGRLKDPPRRGRSTCISSINCGGGGASSSGRGVSTPTRPRARRRPVAT